MPISFKAPVKSALVNETFLDKTVDDETIGVVGLKNTTNVNSGAAIGNTQRYINELADSDGTSGEGDATRKVYSSNDVIADGDDRKTAIGKLDDKVGDHINSIAALDLLVLDGVVKFHEYISDGAYETAWGVPTGGEVYYNSVTGKGRIYDAVEVEWTEIGSGVLGVQEVPTGAVNGVNVDYLLTNQPLNDEGLLVYLDGILSQKTEYSYDANTGTITFNSAPFSGQSVYVFYMSEGNPAQPIISAGTNNVIYHTVTIIEEGAKNFTIASAPVEPTKVLIDVIGGSSQEYSIDFTVSGTTFDWNGLGLDGILLNGDIVRLQYFN